MFESSEHNIEDADHASHMDKANQLDSEIVFSGKSMVSSFSSLNELSISSTNILKIKFLLKRYWLGEREMMKFM